MLKGYFYEMSLRSLKIIFVKEFSCDNAYTFFMKENESA